MEYITQDLTITKMSRVTYIGLALLVIMSLFETQAGMY